MGLATLGILVALGVSVMVTGCMSEPVNEAVPTPVTGETFTQDDYAAYAVANSRALERLAELGVDCGVDDARLDEVLEGEAAAEFWRLEKQLNEFDIPEGFNVLEDRVSDELWQEMAPVAFKFAQAFLGMAVAVDIMLEGEGCETGVAWEEAGRMSGPKKTE